MPPLLQWACQCRRLMPTWGSANKGLDTRICKLVMFIQQNLGSSGMDQGGGIGDFLVYSQSNDRTKNKKSVTPKKTILMYHIYFVRVIRKRFDMKRHFISCLWIPCFSVSLIWWFGMIEG